MWQIARADFGVRRGAAAEAEFANTRPSRVARIALMTPNANQALWQQGDFTQIAALMRTSGEQVVRSLGVGTPLRSGIGRANFLAPTSPPPRMQPR